MSKNKVLLCTDMDRTVIPNGDQPESTQARVLFSALCQSPEIVLAYVSGRDVGLVKEAIRTYLLPTPQFVISDVGSKIYHVDHDRWTELEVWSRKMDQAWAGKHAVDLQRMFEDLTCLTLQEDEKQNIHKLSYYVPLSEDYVAVLSMLQARLQTVDVHANLIWSVDDIEHVGLLDILPANASKLHAVRFLRDYLQMSTDEVVFAGDSGNDLDIMASEIPSVLVANASDEVRREARLLAEQQGHLSQLYFAKGNWLGMNGNYSAGVLEGASHYFPGLREKIKAMHIL
ncbi:MAG: HAD-IIB family hydrolase [Gammaproteobacteria bacterium]|nr:HAD-IIB family hydrolase [Gammaproteobacteria bacterium]